MQSVNKSGVVAWGLGIVALVLSLWAPTLANQTSPEDRITALERQVKNLQQENQQEQRDLRAVEERVTVLESKIQSDWPWPSPIDPRKDPGGFNLPAARDRLQHDHCE